MRPGHGVGSTPPRRGRSFRAPGLVIVLVLAVAASLAVPVGSASAAPGDVVISEMMYNPASGVDGDEFLELTNIGRHPVDISGWCFSGITLCFAAATSIGAGATARGRRRTPPASSSSTASCPAFVYTGSLSNGGETITLKDATGACSSTPSPTPTVTRGPRPPMAPARRSS